MPRLIPIEIGKYRMGNFVARVINRDELSLKASSVERRAGDY